MSLRPNGTGPRPGPFDFGIVKKKVKQIIGRAGLREQDRRDLEQSLLVRVLQALKQFNPKVGHRKALVTAAVERAVASLLRDAKVAQRRRHQVCSLQVVVDILGEQVELCELVNDADYNNRRLSHPRSDEDLSQLTQDIAAALASLPQDQRTLAERLMKLSITEIALEDSVPRTTLNDAVRRLRKPFEDAQLREYL